MSKNIVFHASTDNEEVYYLCNTRCKRGVKHLARIILAIRGGVKEPKKKAEDAIRKIKKELENEYLRKRVIGLLNRARCSNMVSGDVRDLIERTLAYIIFFDGSPHKYKSGDGG